MHVRGKSALITGASSGIGEATARLFASLGARVILVARSASRLAEVAGQIEASGGAAQSYACDLSKPEEIVGMSEAVRRDFGVPDILVNNAGAGRWLSVADTTPDEARAMIEVPYLAAFNLTRTFLPDMVRRGGGHIVNVTSPASYMAWANAAGYIAARHAMKGFTEALRLEAEPAGVKVSLVVLGTVESSYWEHNPGSREHVPEAFAPLSVAEAADAILIAVERSRKYLIRPWPLRLLFAAEALWPGVSSRMTASMPRAKQGRN